MDYPETMARERAEAKHTFMLLRMHGAEERFAAQYDQWLHDEAAKAKAEYVNRKLRELEDKLNAEFDAAAR